MGLVSPDEGEGPAGGLTSVAIKLQDHQLTEQQAKPTHQNIIRLAPPLVISEEEIKSALRIIEEAVNQLPNLKGEAEKKIIPPSEKNITVTTDT
jgi:ornithine--oxo-acid transaminase